MVVIGLGAMKKEQEEVVVDVDSGEEEEEAKKVVKRRRRRKKQAACSDPHKNRACVDCTKRCARIHGRDAPSSSSPLPSSSKARPIPAVPAFFKVMMGYFSETMDIPPPFAQTISDLRGSNIYLEDAFGLRWRVRVCLRDGVLSFGHGWKNFVLDHAVSCGEFLVFRQIARSVFTVQMFAPSAVERLYLCERNKRQSRKRKPRQNATGYFGDQAMKTTAKISSESCKKKQRTDHQNGLGSRDCKMPVQVCIDDSDIPNSASELKCSETSEKALEGADQEVLDGETEIADDCATFKEKQSECNAGVSEMEHGDDSDLPINADASGPLAMMDLNEVTIDDIFLSADIYEFGGDMCNPEAFSVDLNMERPIGSAQNSGFCCLEETSQNLNMDTSMGAGQRETLTCVENKEMTDAPGTCTDSANVPVHDIDINVLPATEPSSFEEEKHLAHAEAHSTECGLSACGKDKDSDLFALKENQAAQEEDTSVMEDKPQDGHDNMQVSARQNDAEIMSSSAKLQEFHDHRQNPLQTGNNSEGLHTGTPESGGILALAVNNTKFHISVPAPGQSWLELPCRLPALPRRKKQGRKVVILKDPCMRLWPVLYQCTPRFNGFITGWVDVSRENNLSEGDTCEFELSGNSQMSFQVLVPNVQ